MSPGMGDSASVVFTFTDGKRAGKFTLRLLRQDARWRVATRPLLELVTCDVRRLDTQQLVSSRLLRRPIRRRPRAEAVRKAVKDTRAHIYADAIGRPLRIRSAARSATMIVGAFVLAPGIRGMIEASTTRSPSTPRTRNSGSTTAVSSEPIRHVPTGWQSRAT